MNSLSFYTSILDTSFLHVFLTPAATSPPLSEWISSSSTSDSYHSNSCINTSSFASAPPVSSSPSLAPALLCCSHSTSCSSSYSPALSFDASSGKILVKGPWILATQMVYPSSRYFSTALWKVAFKTVPSFPSRAIHLPGFINSLLCPVFSVFCGHFHHYERPFSREKCSYMLVNENYKGLRRFLGEL